MAIPSLPSQRNYNQFGGRNGDGRPDGMASAPANGRRSGTAGSRLPIESDQLNLIAVAVAAPSFSPTVTGSELAVGRRDMSELPGTWFVAPCLDGRRARTQRTRQRLIDVYLDLMQQSPCMPTGADIAKRVGCSVRTLFERFPNGAALNHAAAACLLNQEADKKAGQSPPLSHASRYWRMQRHVEASLEGCERWWPLWRAFVLAPERAGLLEVMFDRRRARRSEELRATFHPELSALPEAGRLQVTLAVEVLTSIESWGQLKHRHGLSNADIRETWLAALGKLLPTEPTLSLPWQAA